MYYVEQNRGFLKITGPDRHKFLQGLITNDIYKVSNTQCLYSALLTPQGRFLHDFFIYQHDDVLYLDVKVDRAEDLLKRLTQYRLRSKVELTFEERLIFYVFGDLPFDLNTGEKLPLNEVIGYIDPRLKTLGARIISVDFEPKNIGAEKVNYATYDQHRLALAIPEADSDMIVEKAIPLECGLDELNAIDWNKGCYLGQELNARTKHRGTLHKRLLPVRIEGEPIQPLTPITFQDQEVGTMRSSSGQYGIARLALEALQNINENNSLFAGQTELIPSTPSWLSLKQ